MEPGTAAAAVAVGLLVGLVAGLVGIGGGVLIVPILYLVFAHPELFGIAVDPAARVAAAHATSLFVIVPTVLIGVRAYHRAELVEWRAAWPIGVASVLAVVAGAQVAVAAPGELLQLGFGLLLLASGARLLIRRRDGGEGAPPELRSLRVHPARTVPTGLAAGFFSALLGVGGGIVTLPLMLHLVGVSLRRLAATSLGIIAVTAPAGVATYMLLRPPGGAAGGMVGYVHVGLGALIALGAVASVGLGVRLNRRTSTIGLSRIFAALFLAVGVHLVWTNLPG